MNPVLWLLTHPPEEESEAQRSGTLQLFEKKNAARAVRCPQAKRESPSKCQTLCKSLTRLLTALDVKWMAKLSKAHVG